ncbi:hypothetical protein BSLG_007106 [Batrachochytrium salamandrivorans]|nr:hypothetical protein BASA60_011155 [Batrachochytrium salamandrivorans]KAJ1336322.1 hypothetical protein BSLG_007106 [Batrachochytrium salamandrivorans]
MARPKAQVATAKAPLKKSIKLAEQSPASKTTPFKAGALLQDAGKAQKAPSRKGKKAWRKNVDISQVEEVLEDLRTQERLGGRISEKPSESLFFTDTEGDRNARKALKLKALRMDEILKPDSSIPGVLSRKSLKPTTTAISADGDVIKKDRLASKSVSLQIQVMAKRKKDAGLGPGSNLAMKLAAKDARRAIVKRGKGGFDLWAEEVDVPKTDKDFYLAPTLPLLIVKPATGNRGPKAIPAVRISHPGTSYNPTPEDHNAALLKAAEIEFVKIARKDGIDKQLSYPKELDLLDDETFFEDSDEEEDAKETHDDKKEVDGAEATTDESIKQKNDPKRKTRVQRNREARLAEKRLEQQKRLEQLQISKQLRGLNTIHRAVDKSIKLQQNKLKERYIADQLLESTKPAKLGRYSFQPAPFEIQLKEEIADSLRTLKPEGNMFRDRFKSLQERNLIEARIPVVKRRKYKLKITESHDYKRFE